MLLAAGRSTSSSSSGAGTGIGAAFGGLAAAFLVGVAYNRFKET